MTSGLCESATQKRIASECAGVANELSQAIQLLRDTKPFLGRCSSPNAFELSEKISQFIAGKRRPGETN